MFIDEIACALASILQFEFQINLDISRIWNACDTVDQFLEDISELFSKGLHMDVGVFPFAVCLLGV